MLTSAIVGLFTAYKRKHKLHGAGLFQSLSHRSYAYVFIITRIHFYPGFL